MDFIQSISKTNSYKELIKFLEKNNFSYIIETDFLNKIKSYIGLNYLVKLKVNNGVLKEDLVIEIRIPEFKIIHIYS